MNPEDTTTSTVQEDVQAQETVQPEALETQAVQEQEVAPETTQDQPNGNAAQSESNPEEAELLEWAQKKGVKTDDPVALLKMIREGDNKVRQATTEAKELRKTFENIGEEQGYDETSILLNRLTVTDFYLNNPDAKLLDNEMAEIVKAKPYLASDLETVYKLAKIDSTERQMLAQRQQVKKETLAQVAQAEQAQPPQTAASTRETPKEINDDDIANMTVAEYEEWKKATGFNPFKPAA